MLSIDKISFKSIDAVIYNIKYITTKSINHVNSDSENPAYLIFNNVDGYNEESNADKYLVFAFTDKNKEVLKKYTKPWDGIKNQIKTIDGGEPIEHKKDFMKIRFELSIPDMIIVVGSVLQEENNYYPQVCLHECVYESGGEL